MILYRRGDPAPPSAGEMVQSPPPPPPLIELNEWGSHCLCQQRLCSNTFLLSTFILTQGTGLSPVSPSACPVQVQFRSSSGPVQIQVHSAPQPLVADMKLLLLLLLIEQAAAQQRGEKLSLHSLLLICFCRGQSSAGFWILLVELYEVWLVFSHEEKDSSLTCFWWKQFEQKLNLFERSVFYFKFVMIELFYFNVPAVFFLDVHEFMINEDKLSFQFFKDKSEI